MLLANAISWHRHKNLVWNRYVQLKHTQEVERGDWTKQREKKPQQKPNYLKPLSWK